MSLEKNVVVGRSSNDECFVCESRVKFEETVVAVKFKIPAIITTLEVYRVAHVECAEKLAGLIRKRVAEAKDADRRRPRSR